MSHFHSQPPALVTTSVRLVSESRRLLRPFFAGLAILYRDCRAGATWTVDVLEDGRLLPHAPRSSKQLERIVSLHRALGRTCRVGAALATPADLVSGLADGPVRRPRLTASDDTPTRRRPEIYGWALMYQLPGMQGTAAIDPHDRFDDLPAFFESPLELIDRSVFLAARRIPNRPIAILTRPEDFVRPETGAGWGNRFYPQARFRRPCRLDAVL
jgi:hypothetical protein